jgi:Carboxypeptidase regulatory-like domain
VQPGTNVIPPEKKQEMTNPQPPGKPVEPPAPEGAKPQAASPTVAPQKPAPAQPAPAQAAPAQAAPAGPPSVTGKVLFNGDPPQPDQIDMSAVKECANQHPDGAFTEAVVVNENKGLKNVLVRVTAGLPEDKTFPPPPPAKLDQKGCQYHPHVLGLMVGQQLLISNSDNFLHNVHSMAQENPAFNFGQPNVDPGRPVDPMKAAETFKVKCDVHPWMGAYVVVTNNPFFAVSGDDGSFTLSGLPPGTYTLTTWHETLGQKTAEVKVEAGKPATVEFTYEPP